MDVRIIKEKGILPRRLYDRIYQDGECIGFLSNDEISLEPYKFRILYDGIEFLGGNFGLIERETCSYAVFKDEIKGEITPDKCLKTLESKLEASGFKNIHEVKQWFNSRNLNLELWLIGLLGI